MLHRRRPAIFCKLPSFQRRVYCFKGHTLRGDSNHRHKAGNSVSRWCPIKGIHILQESGAKKALMRSDAPILPLWRVDLRRGSAVLLLREGPAVFAQKLDISIAKRARA